MNILPLPECYKPLAHFIKVAIEHDSRDVVVAYWSRLAALQNGLKMDRRRSSADAEPFLISLMNWLEAEKKRLHQNEAIFNDVVATAHMENYAHKLFVNADTEDRAGRFNKNVVRTFYLVGVIYDVINVSFGELTPENAQERKYAKWKAAYIHNCLKNGETPVPGPLQTEDQSSEFDKNEGTELLPTSSESTVVNQAETTSSQGVSVSSDVVKRVQKCCKQASSALLFDDKATAINLLQEALSLLINEK